MHAICLRESTSPWSAIIGIDHAVQLRRHAICVRAKADTSCRVSLLRKYCVNSPAAVARANGLAKKLFDYVLNTGVATGALQKPWFSTWGVVSPRPAAGASAEVIAAMNTPIRLSNVLLAKSEAPPYKTSYSRDASAAVECVLWLCGRKQAMIVRQSESC